MNVPGLIARLERDGGTANVVVDGTAGVVTIQSAAPPTGGTGRRRSRRGDRSDVTSDRRDGAGAEVPPASGARPTAGYTPGRVPDSRWDDTSTRMHVFVAGLIGAGALVSALVSLTESISSTQGRDRLRRRAAPVALSMADGAVDGYEDRRREPDGLRPRRDYAVAAVVATILAGSHHRPGPPTPTSTTIARSWGGRSPPAAP